MSRVFLCYRRDDSADAVGRVRDRLEERYGAEFVFRDVDDIPLAMDFRAAIDGALRQVRCVLVAIGPDWLEATDAEGNRRLEAADDPVRVEIETALRRDVHLIPLLVRGAAMPPASRLPGDLAKLADRTGQPIRPGQDFEADMDRLFAAIEALVPTPTWWSRVPAMHVALGVLVAAVAAVALAASWVLARPPVVIDVTGLNEVRAAEILAALDIEVTVDEEASDVAQGLVVEQAPAGGARARRVDLVVSTGPAVGVVPDLVGRHRDDAVAELRAAGIQVKVDEAPSAEPGGMVVSQFPEAGIQSAAAWITVSAGREAPLPELPALVGLSEDEARAALPFLDMVIEVEQVEDDSPAGQVLAQDPAAGERAEEVRLTVSAGPGLPVIPDLVGRSVKELRGMTPGIEVTQRKRSSTRRAGTVLSQRPAAGERADAVQVEVSTGPAPKDFAGTWHNVDTGTGSLTRLVITATGGEAVSVQGFGACKPSDCDWGSRAGTVQRGVLGVDFEFSFKKMALRGELSGELLVVEALDDYGSAKSARASTFVLSRGSARRLTEADLEEAMSANPELLEQLVREKNLVEVLPMTQQMLPRSER